MAYRQDRDALQARAEALEQELAAVRLELERAQGALSQRASPEARIARLERDLAAAQREVRALRAKIDAVRQPRDEAARRNLLVGTALALLGISIGALLVSRPVHHPRRQPPALAHPAIPPPPEPLVTEINPDDKGAPSGDPEPQTPDAGSLDPAAITSARSPRPR